MSTQSANEAALPLPAGNGAVVALLKVLTVVGLATLGYRLWAGLGVTHLGSIVPWGLWVAFYIYFIGLSAGSFLLSTLIFVFRVEKLEPVGRLALVQATVCLFLGMVFIFIDLGHWGRAWHVMVYPQTGSILTWESWLYVLYLAIMLRELWLLMRADFSIWSRQATGRAATFYGLLACGFTDPTDPAAKETLRQHSIRTLRTLGLVGIPVALGVHGGTGALFAVVKARPGWNGPLFPLVFIVSALVSGGGLLMFLRSFIHPDDETDHEVLPFLAKLTLGFLVFDLVLMFLEFLAGPFWYIFWGLQLTVGAVIPIWMLTRKAPFNAKRLGLAGALIVVGILGVRMNIVIPPLAVPVFPGYDHAFHSIRMTARYVPNWIEWLSSLGIVAAAALFVRWALPRLPMDDHQTYVER